MRTTIVRADDHETSAREHRVVASTEGFTPQICGFDPLQDIINLAHAEGIEVHAFVIMNAIWGRAPNLFPPENPNRVFNLHGGYDAATNTIIPGPNNWLTRTPVG